MFIIVLFIFDSRFILVLVHSCVCVGAWVHALWSYNQYHTIQGFIWEGVAGAGGGRRKRAFAILRGSQLSYIIKIVEEVAPVTNTITRAASCKLILSVSHSLFTFKLLLF